MMTYLTQQTRDAIREIAHKHSFFVFSYGNNNVIDVVGGGIYIFFNGETGTITAVKNGKKIRTTRFEEITRNKTLKCALDDFFTEIKNL